MNELQDDVKLRESRWSAAANRYKDRIANLEKESKEMKEEVKLLEKQNLELQRKDQLKVWESFTAGKSYVWHRLFLKLENISSRPRSWTSLIYQMIQFDQSEQRF